jgi:hypothetical protein
MLQNTLYCSGSQTFLADGTLKLCNIIVSTPDNKTDGSSEKLKRKVVNEIQFITNTLKLNVKHGTGASCTYFEYRDKFETDTQDILIIPNVYQ